MKGKSRHLKRPKIAPKPIESGISLVDLVDQTLLAYNGARLREACQLYSRHMLDDGIQKSFGSTELGFNTPEPGHVVDGREAAGLAVIGKRARVNDDVDDFATRSLVL